MAVVTYITMNLLTNSVFHNIRITVVNQRPTLPTFRA